METPTAQIVFLIDCDIARHHKSNLQHLVSLISLSSLRILSKFAYDPYCKHLRWGYHFYTLNSLPLPSKRDSCWREFDTENFEEFEDKLECLLNRQTTLVQTPRKPRNRGDADESVEYFQNHPASIYSKILSAAIEDFQWEIPDISSPVRRSAGSLAFRNTKISTENLVFNFCLSPKDQADVEQFVGSTCTSHVGMLNKIMSDGARQKWKEKHLKLIWIDTSINEISQKCDAVQMCQRMLHCLDGSLLSIQDLITFATLKNKVVSSFDRMDVEAPVIPFHNLLDSILHVPRKKSPDNSKQSIIISCNDANLLTIGYHHIDKCTPPLGHRLDSLSVQSCLPSQAVHFYWCDPAVCYLVYTTDADNLYILSNLFHRLESQSKILVLLDSCSNQYYIMRPLTIDRGSLVAVKTQYNSSLLEKLNSQSHTSNAERTASVFNGSLVCHWSHASLNETESSKTSQTKSVDGLKLLQKAYREKKLKMELPLSKPGTNLKKKVVKPTGVSSDVVKPIKLPKEATRRLERGLLLFKERRPASRATSPDNDATSKMDALPNAKSNSSSAKKKIKLKTVSAINLTSEEELLQYVTSSCESACTGNADLYLTAQSIVNTARVFYRHTSDVQSSVESLLSSKAIRSAKDIRKSCLNNPEKKVRECQMSCLLLLELELLKQELLNQQELSQSDIEDLVSKLEEYITCMSVGKPQLLKTFLMDHLVPCYQLTLAPLLAALLIEFGQDVPSTVKRFISLSNMGDKYPFLNSISSQRSSIKSPPMSALPSIGSLTSEPESSLLSQTMIGGSRTLQIRSLSDVTSRRSIAVPSDLIKHRRKYRRLSDNHQSTDSVSSRTRSRTPKKAKSSMLTEFPKGFLSQLQTENRTESHVKSDVRRSPRLASQSASATLSKSVKRDLFSVNTKLSRCKRSPFKMTTPQKSSLDSCVLVAETPKHKQDRTSFVDKLKMRSPSITHVVEESPAKSDSPKAEEDSSSQLVEKTVVGQLKPQRLRRSASFYDAKNIKSRNVEKIEKLETRMRCSLGTSKCTPRRVTNLIFKQALSQPVERTGTRLTPTAVSAVELPSPVLRQKKRVTTHSETNSKNLTPQKSNLKKKLFMSPTTKRYSGEEIDASGSDVILSVGSAIDSGPSEKSERAGHDVTIATASSSMMTKRVEVDGTHFLQHDKQHDKRKTSVQQKRKRSSSSSDQEVEETPQKTHSSCPCGLQTPRHQLRSTPPEKFSSPTQQRVCQYLHPNTPPDFSPKNTHSGACSTKATPSPKRLNFQRRKRPSDHSSARDIEVSFPQLEKRGIVLEDKQKSDQFIDKLMSPYKKTAVSLESTCSTSLTGRSPLCKSRRVRTTPTYSPASGCEIADLMNSPFTTTKL